MGEVQESLDHHSTYGSVRGAPGNRRSYRDHPLMMPIRLRPKGALMRRLPVHAQDDGQLEVVYVRRRLEDLDIRSEEPLAFEPEPEALALGVLEE